MDCNREPETRTTIHIQCRSDEAKAATALYCPKSTETVKPFLLVLDLTLYSAAHFAAMHDPLNP